MGELRAFTSQLIPLLVDNVDTDQIIRPGSSRAPARTGWARGCSPTGATTATATPGGSCSTGRRWPARRLLAGANFGSRSSRSTPPGRSRLRHQGRAGPAVRRHLPQQRPQERAAPGRAAGRGPRRAGRGRGRPDAEVTVDLEAEMVTLNGRVAGFKSTRSPARCCWTAPTSSATCSRRGPRSPPTRTPTSPGRHHRPRRGWLRGAAGAWSWFPPARSPCAWPPRPARASPTGPCSAPPWPTAPAACSGPRPATTPTPWPPPWPSWAPGSTAAASGRWKTRTGAGW